MIYRGFCLKQSQWGLTGTPRYHTSRTGVTRPRCNGHKQHATHIYYRYAGSQLLRSIHVFFFFSDMHTTCSLILVGYVTSILMASDICLDFHHFEQLRFFCPGNTLYWTHVALPHCKLTYIQTPSCNAINYNTSSGICEQVMIPPCHEANRGPFMLYFRFTQIRPEACFHWQEMSSMEATDPRLVYNQEITRYVCRLVYQSSAVYLGYVEFRKCWSGDKQALLSSPGSNFVSEVQLIHPMCTIGFIAGERLPRSSMSVGATASGDMTYIARLFIQSRRRNVFGYYTTESDEGYANYDDLHQFLHTMDLLIVI